MDISGHVYFIGNHLDVTCALPAQIAEDVRIERPSPEHLEWYRKYLKSGTYKMANLLQWYESDVTVKTTKDNPRSSSIHLTALPPDKWKYLVVASKGNGMEAHQFFMAANLVPPALWSVAHLMTKDPFGQGEGRGWGWDPVESAVRSFGPMTGPHNEPFTEDTVSELRSALVDLRALDERRFQDILRAVRLIFDLKGLPPLSDLKVLGWFAAMEMLLTHSPSLKGNDDSISHQLRTKIALLDERLPVQLDYSAFGKDTNPKKVWSALYGYRSAVAHGDLLDFKSDSLKPAKTKAIADTFLYHAVRAIARHALREPALYEALRPI